MIYEGSYKDCSFTWCFNKWETVAHPDGGYDHVITDPGYTDHVQDRLLSATKTKGKVKQHKAKFEATNSDLAFAKRLIGLSKRWSMFCCAVEQLGDYQRTEAGLWVRSGIYCKLRAMPQLSGDRPANRCEGISIFHAKGRKRWNGGGHHAFWLARPENRSVTRHPTAKPLVLCRQLIEQFTDPGETIFDPFGGVASLGVACLLLGRNYVGCEIKWKHFTDGLEDLRNPEAALLRRCGKKGWEIPDKKAA